MEESSTPSPVKPAVLAVAALVILVVGSLAVLYFTAAEDEVEEEVTEPQEELVCGEVDVDLQRDRRHCGECQNECEDDQICRGGECGDALAWTQISAGGDAVCGLRRDDSLWCWDDDLAGPTQVGDESWSAISVGDGGERCGIQEDQKLWCWSSQEEPAEVSDQEWASVSAGLGHSCGIRDDDTLWCWGRNDRGQLGDGTTEDRDEPVEVSSAAGWKAVSAASYYTCGLSEDGSLWCWGSSNSHHPTESATTPEVVGTSMDWTYLEAGAFDTCAVKEDKSRWCWGQHQFRSNWELGSLAEGPREIKDGEWRDIALGPEFFCGIREDHTLWCNNQRPGRRLAQVGEDTDWTAVTRGMQRACGIREGGTLWCWKPREEPALIEDVDPEAAAVDEEDQRALEFFLAGDDLRWYRMDSDGVELLRTLELPGPIQDMVWVDHRGLAVMTFEVQELPYESEEERPTAPAIDGALITGGCGDIQPSSEASCRFSIRRLLLLDEDDLESGEFSSLALPEDQDWPVDRGIMRLDDGNAGTLVSDFHLPRTGQGDLWVHRCHAVDYTDDCLAESRIRILPNLQRGRNVEARRRQPIELQSSPSPPGYLAAGLRGVVGEVDLLCLAPDGTASESERKYGDHATTEVYWVAHDPPTFVARETYFGEYGGDYGYTAHRACDGEPFMRLHHFQQGPGQSAFMRVDEGWQVYFQMRDMGPVEGGEELLFRPQDPPSREPAPEGEPEEPANLSQYRATSLAERALVRFPGRHRCDTFDYFPNGGIYSIYCRIEKVGTLGVLEEALGMPVFLDGPHKDGALNVREGKDFGRYNPEFVESLGDWLLPVIKSQVSSFVYRENLQRLARTYWLVYQALRADREFWDRETELFKASLTVENYQDHQWRPGEYFRFEISSTFEFTDDPNIRYYAVRYWLRRTVDETHSLFAENLRVILENYDQRFLAAH